MTIHTIERQEGATAEKKKERGKCIVYQCRRMAGKGRAICNTCRDRAWRAKHPEHHLWKNLKKSAKKRGVAFTITVEYFMQWCRENNFVAKVGRGPDDATVDRRDPQLGYEPGNLRVLTQFENSSLGGPLANSGHRTRGQFFMNFTPPADPDEPAF